MAIIRARIGYKSILRLLFYEVKPKPAYCNPRLRITIRKLGYFRKTEAAGRNNRLVSRFSVGGLNLY
jgi:hypothetical protein